MIKSFHGTIFSSLLVGCVMPLSAMTSQVIDIHRAAKQNKYELVQQFITDGINVNSLDLKRNSPLHWAARNGHEEIVRLLVDEGAMLDILNEKGRTPLQEAQRNAHRSIIDFLENNDSNLSRVEKKSVPTQVPQAPQPPIAEKSFASAPIIASRINTKDFLGKTELFNALESGDYKRALQLLAKGADPTIAGPGKVTPLHLAVALGDEHIVLVRELLKKGANPHKKDYEDAPLHIAAKLGNQAIEVIGELIKHGARCTQPSDSENHTPFTIIWAKIKDGKFNRYDKVLRLFLLYGVNANEKSSSWSGARSYLEDAVTFTQGIEIAALMIECGADVANLDKHTLGLILFPLINSPQPVVAQIKAVLAAGAKHYLFSDDGHTPLLKAAMLGESGCEVLELLLDYGSDIDAVSKTDQKSALHYSVDLCCLRAVELLCQKGADPSRPDCAGMSPLEYANKQGREAIKIYLSDYLKKMRARPIKQKEALAVYPLDNDLQDQLFRAIGSIQLSPGLIKELLKKGADPLACNGKGESAFLLIAYKGLDVEALPILRACISAIKAREKQNDLLLPALNSTLIAISSHENLAGVAEFLLDEGADVNGINVVGETA